MASIMRAMSPCCLIRSVFSENRPVRIRSMPSRQLPSAASQLVFRNSYMTRIISVIRPFFFTISLKS